MGSDSIFAMGSDSVQKMESDPIRAQSGVEGGPDRPAKNGV
jgi:hypothetical protein